MRPEIADESSALSPPASRTHQSPPRLSSTRAASQSPGASSAAGQSNKRPSPAEATADTSPVKKIRNSLSGIGNGRDARRTDPASADVHMQPPHLSSTEPGQATDVANQDEEEEDDDPTASENSTDDEQPDRPSGPVPTLDQRALSLPVPPPAPAPVSVPLPVAKREPSSPQELPPASSSRDTDMELSPPPTELASRLAPTSSSANTSPSKGGPPPSRTIVAPLRKSGAPARGTARSRRF
ncbi:hypothetical protein OC835_000626 [Tilletia horrida]|nr:hypothetical protein OC835_000626 [Tilletia horrida]